MDPELRLAALERENAALRHAVLLLHEVSHLLHGSLEVEAACYAVLTGVTAGVGLGFNRAVLFQTGRTDATVLEGTMGVGPADEAEADRVWREIEAGQDDLRTLYQAGLAARDAHAPIDRQVRALRLPLAGSSLLARAVREGKLVHGQPGDDELGGLLDVATGVAAPLLGESGIVGVLYADNRFTQRRFDPVLEHVFSLVAGHAGRAVENARRFQRQAHAARTDTLTGLGHHGALMERLALELAQPRPLSLVMVDLDNFKGVNDRHGHLAGDELLRRLAGRLQSTLREGEQAFRYGGEEFALVLPGVEAPAACAIAERIRAVVADSPFTVPGAPPLHVTCSLGVQSRQPETSVLELVAAADRALFQAKRTGKNRVVRAEP